MLARVRKPPTVQNSDQAKTAMQTVGHALQIDAPSESVSVSSPTLDDSCRQSHSEVCFSANLSATSALDFVPITAPVRTAGNLSAVNSS